MLLESNLLSAGETLGPNYLVMIELQRLIDVVVAAAPAAVGVNFAWLNPNVAAAVADVAVAVVEAAFGRLNSIVNAVAAAKRFATWRSFVVAVGYDFECLLRCLVNELTRV